MQEVVTAPFLFFLRSILFGMGLVFCYDIIRITRSVFHHKPVFVVIEDFLFAVFVAVTSFLFLCTYNYGELRGFFFLGLFLGMFFYYRKASQGMRKRITGIFLRVKQLFCKLCCKILRPMIYIRTNMKWTLKKEKKQVTMALKRQTKRGDRSGTKEKIK